MDPEIEELKAQVASLREQLVALTFAREDAASGGGEIPTHFFPIGQVGGSEVTLVGNDATPGSEAKVRSTLLFENEKDQSNNEVANVRITVEEDAHNDDVTRVKIGVFYV